MTEIDDIVEYLEKFKSVREFAFYADMPEQEAHLALKELIEIAEQFKRMNEHE